MYRPVVSVDFRLLVAFACGPLMVVCKDRMGTGNTVCYIDDRAEKAQTGNRVGK